MKRIIVIVLTAVGGILLFAPQQRAQNPLHVPFEVLSVFPRETSPGFFAQVDQRELQSLAEQGWELAGVTPFVYRNEERGSGNPKAVVTQTYSAYFFKRAKMIR